MRSIGTAAAGLLTLALFGAPLDAALRHRTFEYSYGSIGIVSGQSIVVSVTSVLPVQYPPNPCRVILLDTLGQTVFDSGVFQLPAVQSQAFTINWGDLPPNPNSIAGRAQVRAVIVIDVASPDIFPRSPCATSVSIVDGTGHTVAIQPGVTPFRVF
jgi:hypothetical protein